MLIAVALTVFIFIAAASFVVAGIFMLVGTAWALIAVGILLFGAGIFLRSGLTPNG